MTIEIIPADVGHITPHVQLVPAPLHFSDLKLMSRSPMHVHHARTSSRREPTRAMRIGTIVHHLVCGPHTRKPLLRFDGDARKGNAWESFRRAAPPGAELVTATEWAEAEPIAAAVLADPIAAPIIRGSRREVALAWDDAGISCATDGIDGVNEALGVIWDLKLSHSSEPSEFSRHGSRMGYHAQMAWYQRAARANGIRTDGGVYLFTVEQGEPHPVTTFDMRGDPTAAGERAITLWLERYRACHDSKAWPGYVQSIVPFELPSWVPGDEVEETAGED